MRSGNARPYGVAAIVIFERHPTFPPILIVSGLHLRRPERLLPQGKREIECGAAPDLALGPYAAPVTQDDALYVCQADSRSLEVSGAVQSLEDAEEFARIPHV